MSIAEATKRNNTHDGSPREDKSKKHEASSHQTPSAAPDLTLYVYFVAGFSPADNRLLEGPRARPSKGACLEGTDLVASF